MWAAIRLRLEESMTPTLHRDSRSVMATSLLLLRWKHCRFHTLQASQIARLFQNGSHQIPLTPLCGRARALPLIIWRTHRYVASFRMSFRLLILTVLSCPFNFRYPLLSL